MLQPVVTPSGTYSRSSESLEDSSHSSIFNYSTPEHLTHAAQVTVHVHVAKAGKINSSGSQLNRKKLVGQAGGSSWILHLVTGAGRQAKCALGFLGTWHWLQKWGGNILFDAHHTLCLHALKVTMVLLDSVLETLLAVFVVSVSVAAVVGFVLLCKSVYMYSAISL